MRIFGEDSIDAKEEGRCKQVSTADGSQLHARRRARLHSDLIEHQRYPIDAIGITRRACVATSYCKCADAPVANSPRGARWQALRLITGVAEKIVDPSHFSRHRRLIEFACAIEHAAAC